MYTLTVGKNKKAAVEVYLDTRNPRQPNPSAIPPHVGLGTGDKKKRYKTYLGKCFGSNSELLRYLAYLHKLAKEKGSMTLIATHKMGKTQTEGVKEFLEENRETLDAILPYIFPGEGYKAPENIDQANLPDEVKAQLESQMSAPMQGTAQLSEDDMAQIKALIAEDQAHHAHTDPSVDTNEGSSSAPVSSV